METLKDEVCSKLNHILHDIKELQKTVIHLKQEEKKAEERVSNWVSLGKEISSKWAGYDAVEEIREQRDKKW
ncbi:MAG: hypothetical protein A2889_11060 [Nitrospinae bacterium RIFCSPLOWO2_01_FULL_39_10]|nr:MAG: hypothetical protein A2889_11060 [Nitrospinae bacterium RIFCSPLOWO2_01_FULL_39_10]